MAKLLERTTRVTAAADSEAWQFVAPATEARSLFDLLRKQRATAASLRALIRVEPEQEVALLGFVAANIESREAGGILRALAFREAVLAEFERLLYLRYPSARV